MAGVGVFGVLAMGFLVLAPLALYYFVSAEEPDDDGTSWDEARRQAQNDGGERSGDRDEDETDGNHWS